MACFAQLSSDNVVATNLLVEVNNCLLRELVVATGPCPIEAESKVGLLEVGNEKRGNKAEEREENEKRNRNVAH
jgi:hypothetical protein